MGPAAPRDDHPLGPRRRLRERLSPDLLSGWSLRIIGPHRSEQGGDGEAYLASLRALAAAHAMACAFVAPIFDEHALAAEYRRASVFVYPSLAEAGESLGLAPLEAMAAGCAAIVSGLNCFADYIEEGITGLQFDHRGADSAADLAAKLGLLVAEPDRLQKIAEGGRRAAANFRVTEIAGRMLDDFHSVLDERSH